MYDVAIMTVSIVTMRNVAWNSNYFVRVVMEIIVIDVYMAVTVIFQHVKANERSALVIIIVTQQLAVNLFMDVAGR